MTRTRSFLFNSLVCVCVLDALTTPQFGNSTYTPLLFSPPLPNHFFFSFAKFAYPASSSSSSPLRERLLSYLVGMDLYRFARFKSFEDSLKSIR